MQIQTPNPAADKPGVVILEQYSERALVVRGDTKPVKDVLKANGGRYNARLRCGPGWIFRATERASIEALVLSLNAPNMPEPSAADELTLQVMGHAPEDRSGLPDVETRLDSYDDALFDAQQNGTPQGDGLPDAIEVAEAIASGTMLTDEEKEAMDRRDEREAAAAIRAIREAEQGDDDAAGMIEAEEAAGEEATLRRIS